MRNSIMRAGGQKTFMIPFFRRSNGSTAVMKRCNSVVNKLQNGHSRRIVVEECWRAKKSKEGDRVDLTLLDELEIPRASRIGR